MNKKLIISISIIIVLLAFGTFWYLYKNTYYHNSAIKNSNPASCLKINNDLKISQCLGKVAVKVDNAGICTNSPRMYIMVCFGMFAENGGSILRCSEVEPGVDEYNCYAAFGQSMRTTSACGPLSGEKQDYCKKIVATTTKNISLCEELMTSGYKESCIEIIKSNP